MTIQWDGRCFFCNREDGQKVGNYHGGKLILCESCLQGILDRPDKMLLCHKLLEVKA